MADGTIQALELIQTTLVPLGVPVELAGNPLPSLPFVQTAPVADTPYNGLDGEYETFTRIQVTAWASSLTEALITQEAVRALLIAAGFQRLQTQTVLSGELNNGVRSRGAAADYQFIRG